MSKSPASNSVKMEDSGNPFRWFWVIALLVLVIRLISLWFNNSELFFDEAQYWVWAKEPDFGYYSKPPLLAWIIGATTSVCGDSEFCTRLSSPLFHTATAYVLYVTADRLFDARTALVAGITWLLLPAVSLSSTLISTDVPLLLFWSVALYAFIRLNEGEGYRWAIVLGLAIGLGLNAKYAMAFFIACGFILALLVPERRKLLRDSRWWLAIAIALIMLVPNVIWNLNHHFATIEHTGDNMDWGGFPHFDRLAEFIASQFGVAGPILFAVYLIALFRLAREGATPTQKILVAFSLPVLLAISFQAIMSKAFANWAATAMPALVLLVSHLLVSRMPPIWNRLSTGLHAVVFAALAIAVSFAAPGQQPIPDSQNPFQRMWGGKSLAELLKPQIASGRFSYVLADSRKRSSTLIYYLRDEPVDVVTWRAGVIPLDHFEMTRALQDMEPELLKDAKFLYPTLKPKIDRVIAGQFASVELVAEGAEYDGSNKTYFLYALGGYRGATQ